MQLTTIEMPKEEAEKRLAEYQKLVAGERTQQDERIAAGYRVMARGLPLIKLSESIQRGGFFDNGLPRIAIARADSQDCWINVDGPSWNGRGAFVYSSEQPDWSPRNRGALVNKVTVRVSIPNMPTVQRRAWRAHTMMPIIPPQHRPKLRRLRHFHILWEVEAWTLVPPKDPALLRWVGGDLWAVVAVWDLTELERAVLSR